jgi:hypothetical protein
LKTFSFFFLSPITRLFVCLFVFVLFFRTFFLFLGGRVDKLGLKASFFYWQANFLLSTRLLFVIALINFYLFFFLLLCFTLYLEFSSITKLFVVVEINPISHNNQPPLCPSTLQLRFSLVRISHSKESNLAFSQVYNKFIEI